MIARVLTVTGPSGAADRTTGVAAARLVKRFQRMDGFLGGIIMVDERGACIRTTGFWENEEAVTASLRYAEEMGSTMARTIFRSEGTFDLQTFEVVAIDPPPAVEFPSL